MFSFAFAFPEMSYNWLFLLFVLHFFCNYAGGLWSLKKRILDNQRRPSHGILGKSIRSARQLMPDLGFGIIGVNFFRDKTVGNFIKISAQYPVHFLKFRPERVINKTL